MKRKDYSDDIKYRDSRYVPIIKDVMQYTAEDKLDKDIFGSFEFQKSKTKSTSAEETKPKLVIFIIGGVTCSEIRCAYEVSNEIPKEVESSWFSFGSKELTEYDVFIGSTHLAQPTQQLNLFV